MNDWWAAPAAVPAQPLGRRARWYQREIKTAVHAELARYMSTIVVAATGVGKTFTFCDFARDYPGRGLILAHRDELCRQTIAALEEATGELVGLEKAESQNDGERLVVGSIQSFSTERCNRLGKDAFAFIIVDECFPAGTLVDGIPIEQIREGDHVLSMNHYTGVVQPRRVTRIMRRPAPARLVTISSGETTVRCTENHPFFVEGFGYVQARDLAPSDMLCMWQPVHGAEVAPKENVLRAVSSAQVVGDYGEYQPGPRLRQNDKSEPHETGSFASEDEGYAVSNRTQASGARRQWNRLNEVAVRPIDQSRGRLGSRAPGGDWDGPKLGVSNLLQTGPSLPQAEVWSGTRRGFSWLSGAPSSGQEEICALVWSRLDSVENQECDGFGYVYNLEVEGTHTYFANGILVHNCHHAPSPTYRRVLEFFNAKVVGFTATPDRADEKGLVAVFESVAYTYEILDAINDGFLCPLDARQVHLDEIDLTDVDSSGGDLAVGQLDEAMRKCVEGVAVKTLELAGDRQGIVFWPGVKSAEAACIRFSALKLGCSAWVYAKTPEHERRAIIKAFRAGQVQFIHNVGVLTEGFDAPESSVVVIARPTKSRGLYAQILGRGLRPAPGTIDQWTERDEAELRRLAIAQSRKPNAMILDFVGNAGKHSLVGPADVLGGNDPDEVVTIARKKVAGGQGDVAQALADARRELEEAMRRTKSTVKARVEAFDPFMVVGESDLQVQKYTRRFGYVSATPGQLGALRKFGLVEKEIAGLSKMAASKLIDTLVARAKSGLVGYKALKRFQGFGVTETDIPRERGKMAMDYIAANGWDRANPVTVRKILLERQPGDEG